MLSGVNQALDDVSENLFQGLDDQLVLAREMFVKPSVSQTGVTHNSGHGCCPLQAFGADAPGGVLHDLLVSLDLVLGTITHDR